MSAETKPTEGWTWLYNSRKWHYFRDGKALCGNWMLLRDPTDGYAADDDSPDNCAACARKRAKEREKSAKNAEKAAKNAKKQE